MPELEQCERCKCNLWDIGSWNTEDETFIFVECRGCGAQRHFKVTPQSGDIIGPIKGE